MHFFLTIIFYKQQQEKVRVSFIVLMSSGLSFDILVWLLWMHNEPQILHGQVCIPSFSHETSVTEILVVNISAP